MQKGMARNHSTTKKRLIIKKINKKFLQGGKNGNSSKNNGR
jgi:hypothetical protein